MESSFCEKYGKYIVFAAFFLLCFIKLYVFHWMVYESIPLSSLWRYPQQFFAFHLPKIAICLFFSAFALMDRHWVTVVFSFLLDIWIIANLIYFRSYDSMLDIYAFSMADNMKGWWGSIFFFMSYKDIIYPLSSVVYLVVYKFLRGGCNWSLFVLLCVLSYPINLIGVECHRYCFMHNYDKRIVGIAPHYYNPFSYAMRNVFFTNHTKGVVGQFSIFHQVGFIINDLFRTRSAIYQLTEEDMSWLENMQILQPMEEKPVLERPVIIVLWESLEDWAVNPISTPNLCRFMEHHPHLHVTKLSRQVRGGNSMDGQMILNTGLLPISEGAVAFTFPHHTFPSIADCSNGPDAVIVPHEARVWNQSMMSPAFGYDTTISVLPEEEYLFGKTKELCDSGYLVIQAVTAASHAPFDFGAERSSLQFIAPQMPHYMQAYMAACHYTDQHLALLLEAFDTDSTFSNAVLLITGDHTIFSKTVRQEFQNYADEQQWQLHCNNAFCPLIIYAPEMTETKVIDDVVGYQMDAFPTLMSCIGLQNYYWKGFGVNMLDSTRFNRRFTEEEAYEMSDHLIRSNYFESLPTNH